MIPKPEKDLKTPNNHRPISLLNSTSSLRDNFGNKTENSYNKKNMTGTVCIPTVYYIPIC